MNILGNYRNIKTYFVNATLYVGTDTTICFDGTPTGEIYVIDKIKLHLEN